MNSGVAGRKPVAFLSSAMRSLKGLRRAVWRRLEALGWDCVAAGENEQLITGPLPEAFLKPIEHVDVFVGLYATEPGSFDAATGLFPSELELFWAQSLNKPRYLYVLNAGRPHRQLRIFLEALKYEEYVRVESTPNRLLNMIVREMEKLAVLLQAGRAFEVTPTTFPKDISSRAPLLLLETGRYGLAHSAGAKVPALPVEKLEELCRCFLELRAASRNAEAFELGARILQDFLQSPPDPGDRRSRLLFGRFLHSWAGCCTWAGYDGSCGGTWAAETARRCFHGQGAWHEAHSAVGRLANTLYVRASLLENQMRAADPETRLVLYREYRRILRRALYCDEWQASRGRQRTFHEANVFERLGFYDLAIASFRGKLRFAERKTATEWAVAAAELGLVLVKKGRRDRLPAIARDGMQLLDRAVGITTDDHGTPWPILIKKRFAQGLFLSGDREIALALLEEIRHDAALLSMWHQVASIDGLLSRANGD